MSIKKDANLNLLPHNITGQFEPFPAELFQSLNPRNFCLVCPRGIWCKVHLIKAYAFCGHIFCGHIFFNLLYLYYENNLFIICPFFLQRREWCFGYIEARAKWLLKRPTCVWAPSTINTMIYENAELKLLVFIVMVTKLQSLTTMVAQTGSLRFHHFCVELPVVPYIFLQIIVFLHILKFHQTRLILWLFYFISWKICLELPFSDFPNKTIYFVYL